MIVETEIYRLNERGSVEDDTGLKVGNISTCVYHLTVEILSSLVFFFYLFNLENCTSWDEPFDPLKKPIPPTLFFG